MPNKKTKPPLPQRNTAAETATLIGYYLLPLYAICTLLMSFIIVVFNDTGSSVNGPVAIAVFIYGVNLVAQSILAVREIKRVDRYKQRIIALSLLHAPAFVTLLTHALVPLGDIQGLRALTDAGHEILHTGLYVSLGLSIVGSVWLWLRLLDKDKLVWIVQPSSNKSKKSINDTVRFFNKRKLGLWLIASPIIIFSLQIVAGVSVGLLGGNSILGLLLLPILWIFGLASMLWLPLLIAGIIILNSSKQ